MRQTRHYTSYQEYLDHQASKTLAIHDGRLPIAAFGQRQGMMGLLLLDAAKYHAPGRALCLGARRGEEVAALRSLGWDAIGIDIVPCEPWVTKGDFHHVEYPDASFELVYTNAVDHAFDLNRMLAEVRRVLVPGGLLYCHLDIGISDEWTSVFLGDIADFHETLTGFSILVSESMPVVHGLNHKLIARKEAP